MSTILKRSVPLAITFMTVIILILTFFFNLGPFGETLDKTLIAFATILASAALGLGIINTTKTHVIRIAKREKGQWIYSVALIAALLFMVGVGLLYGAASYEYSLLFDATVGPFKATLMAMFIVWVTPAFVRITRIKNINSMALITAMFLTVIGQSPIGTMFGPVFANISGWLNTVLNMGVQRGFKITIALGLIVMTVRIILGKERSYLRKEVTG